MSHRRQLLEVIDIEIADAPVADLARPFESFEGLDGFGQRVRTAPVQQVEVETVGLQAAQAALAGGNRSLARGVVRVDLADEVEAVTLAGHRLPDDLLGAALAVHFGGVEQPHAEIKTKLERLDLGAALALALAHAPGAEAQHGNAFTGFQGNRPHRRHPLLLAAVSLALWAGNGLEPPHKRCHNSRIQLFSL